MSKTWMMSNLILGEELKVSKNIFIAEGDKALERLVGVYYVWETDAGIMVDCVFKPNFGRKAEDSHYHIFISWSSIWCGHITVNRNDGTMVRARFKKNTNVYGKNVEVISDEKNCVRVS